jgi:hypothetical protein
VPTVLVLANNSTSLNIFRSLGYKIFVTVRRYGRSTDLGLRAMSATLKSGAMNALLALIESDTRPTLIVRGDRVVGCNRAARALLPHHTRFRPRPRSEPDESDRREEKLADPEPETA